MGYRSIGDIINIWGKLLLCGRWMRNTYGTWMKDGGGAFFDGNDFALGVDGELFARELSFGSVSVTVPYLFSGSGEFLVRLPLYMKESITVSLESSDAGSFDDGWWWCYGGSYINHWGYGGYRYVFDSSFGCFWYNGSCGSSGCGDNGTLCL